MIAVNVSEAGPKTISRLIEHLPEFEYKDTPEDIMERIDGKDGKCFVARIRDQECGFLVAYGLNPHVYYNWLTGVLPDYRGKELGKVLLRHFESYALDQDYSICRVKSMNQFPTMLRLLINLKYDIVSTEADKIVFEKGLSPI